MDHLAFKATNFLAKDNIPEVLHFEKIIHGISEDYYAKSVAEMIRSMEKTTGAFLTTSCLKIRFLKANTSNSMIDIVRRFIRDSRTAGGQQMLSMGDLGNYLPIVDEDHVQPLMQSLETLSGIIQELQDDTT